MKALRITLLAIGLASVAACGGKNKSEDTTGNTGGDEMTDDGMGGDAYGGMDGCSGHDDMGGGGMDGCDGGE